jgi:hypothetical protein
MGTKHRFLLASSIVGVALALLFLPGCFVPDGPDPILDKGKGGTERQPEEDNTVTIVLLSAIGGFLLIGGTVLFLRAKKEQKLHDPNLELHYRCVGCKKKISYSPRRIGQHAECPACGKPFTFPDATPVGPKPPKRIV